MKHANFLNIIVNELTLPFFPAANHLHNNKYSLSSDITEQVNNKAAACNLVMMVPVTLSNLTSSPTQLQFYEKPTLYLG